MTTNEENNPDIADDNYQSPREDTHKQEVVKLDEDIQAMREKLAPKFDEENERAPIEEKPAAPEGEAGAPDAKAPDGQPKPEPVYDEVTGRYRDPVTKAFVADPNKAKEDSEKGGAGDKGSVGEDKGGQADQGQESAYAKASKAEKDAARLARTTQQLQRERDEWKARAEQSQRAPAPGPARSDNDGSQTRFSSDEFSRAAAEFLQQAETHLKNDDTEAAAEAFGWAKKAQASAQQAYNAEQEQAYTQQQQGFLEQWQDNVSDVIKEAAQEDIDLMNEEDPTAKAIMEILDTEPVLNYLPDGFRKAYELTQLRKSHEELPKAKARIAELEAQVNKLTKGRTPVTGQRSRPAGPKKFEDMTMNEQREYLKSRQYS